MNISSRCDYACRAAIELARQYRTGQPLTATAIAAARDIPEKYLVHILLQLKRRGIVRSVRGAQGGYLLAGPPETVTLYDVVTAVDGEILDPLPGASDAMPDMAGTWRHVAEGIGGVLKGVTLQSIVERGAEANMYYI